MHGMESTIVDIGSYSGSEMDKFRAFEGRISLCAAGWEPLDRDPAGVGAIAECVAHMACTVK